MFRQKFTSRSNTMVLGTDSTYIFISGDFTAARQVWMTSSIDDNEGLNNVLRVMLRCLLGVSRFLVNTLPTCVLFSMFSNPSRSLKQVALIRKSRIIESTINLR